MGLTYTRSGLVAVASLTLLLSACDRPDGGAEPTAGQKLDSAIEKTEQRVDQAQVATQQLGQKMEDSAEKTAQKLQDARITASIKAELAGDPKLSPLAIQVQTQDGLVSLNGKAPDPATRDHATRVAATVKGVLSVDNHMVLNG